MNNLNELFEAYQEHPIAYMPIYSKITGSVTAGILLSQIVYWDGKMKHRQFYKTDKDFCNELSMGPSELKNAKKILQTKEIVLITRKGIPAKTHYHLNRNNLTNLLISWIKNSQQVVSKTSNNKGGNKTTTTDTTTEITPEITNNNNSLFDKQKVDNQEKNQSIKEEDRTFSLKEYATYRKNIPDKILDAILWYSESYEEKFEGASHPRLKLKQWWEVEARLIDTHDIYNSESDDEDTNALCNIIDEWFKKRDNRNTDFNIIHFVTGEIIDNCARNAGLY